MRLATTGKQSSRVTASPIVAQGGECMCSFYDADGNGGAAKIQFATVDTNLALTATDFFVF